MEKINWIVGDEKRFAEFIGNLNEKDKIALLCHTDLDGVASAKIVYEVIRPDLVMFVSYEELDDRLIKELKKNKTNKIIMCDLYLNEMSKKFSNEIQKLGKVLIIDHHPFLYDLNIENSDNCVTFCSEFSNGQFSKRSNINNRIIHNEKIVFLNAEGYCATYLCYTLFSRIKNLENYDWLVACACISDWRYKKNWGWMERVFERYGEKFRGGMAEGIKEGKFIEIVKILCMALTYFERDIKKVFDRIGSAFGDIGDLSKYAEEVEKEITNCIERFEREKEKIAGGYFWNFVKKNFSVLSSVATIISVKYLDKTILILEEDGNLCRVSGRRQDKGEDMNKLLKKLIVGFEKATAGGHVAASGGHFLRKDKEKFLVRLRNL